MRLYLVAVAYQSWRERAACKNDPRFTVDAQHGLNNELRAQARHICRAHCPVVEECLADAKENPPSGTVQGGLLWDDWGSRPRKRQPADTGCGPWCRQHRDIPQTVVRDTGRIITDLRLARGWTMDDLAVKSGLSQTTVSRIESGRRSGLTRRVEYGGNTALAWIAAALEVPVDDLLVKETCGATAVH